MRQMEGPVHTFDLKFKTRVIKSKGLDELMFAPQGGTVWEPGSSDSADDSTPTGASFWKVNHVVTVSYTRNGERRPLGAVFQPMFYHLFCL